MVVEITLIANYQGRSLHQQALCGISNDCFPSLHSHNSLVNFTPMEKDTGSRRNSWKTLKTNMLATGYHNEQCFYKNSWSNFKTTSWISEAVAVLMNMTWDHSSAWWPCKYQTLLQCGFLVAVQTDCKTQDTVCMTAAGMR